MLKIVLGDEDANKKGIILGLGLPSKYQTRLGVVLLFRKLRDVLAEKQENKDLDHYTIWPVSITMPCRRKYVYKGPDDFPLETVMCRCKNPKHRPVVWSSRLKKPTDSQSKIDPDNPAAD